MAGIFGIVRGSGMRMKLSASGSDDDEECFFSMIGMYPIPGRRVLLHAAGDRAGKQENNRSFDLDSSDWDGIPMHIPIHNAVKQSYGYPVSSRVPRSVASKDYYPDHSELVPISLLVLQDETEGHVLYGTLSVVPCRVMTILEAEDNAYGVKVAVYDEDRLWRCKYLLGKEPYLKFGLDGVRCVRVSDPTSLKSEGNRYFAQKNWERAIDAYTRCILKCKGSAVISSSDDSKLKMEVLLASLSNRAEAFLRSGDFEKALMDSNKALKIDPEHFKSIYRKGRALEGLQEFELALHWLQQAFDSFPVAEIEDRLNKLRVCNLQSKTGEFNIREYQLVQGLLPTCSDFVGPVAVKKATGCTQTRHAASVNWKPEAVAAVGSPVSVAAFPEADGSKSSPVAVSPCVKDVPSVFQGVNVISVNLGPFLTPEKPPPGAKKSLHRARALREKTIVERAKYFVDKCGLSHEPANLQDSAVVHLFHGTRSSYWNESFRTQGIKPPFHYNEFSTSSAFYLSNVADDAYSQPLFNHPETRDPVALLVFEVNTSIFNETLMSIRKFDGPLEDWRQFCLFNLLQQKEGSSEYDVVIGPMCRPIRNSLGEIVDVKVETKTGLLQIAFCTPVSWAWLETCLKEVYVEDRSNKILDLEGM